MNRTSPRLAWVAVALVAVAVAACDRSREAERAERAAREEHERLTAERDRLRAEREALDAELRKLRAEREQAPARPLSDALLGNWTATDPESDLRGMNFSKDLSASVAYISNADKKEIRPAKYELVGNSLKLTILVDGSFTGSNRITFDMHMEVVRATDRELTIRRDRHKNGQVAAKAKEERLVRE